MVTLFIAAFDRFFVVYFAVRFLFWVFWLRVVVVFLDLGIVLILLCVSFIMLTCRSFTCAACFGVWCCVSFRLGNFLVLYLSLLV